MPVAVALAAVAQPAQRGRRRHVVHEQGAPVPQGPEVLRGIERESAQALLPAQRPHRPALVERADGLTGVLEDEEPPRARDLQEGIHVRGVAVEVDGKDDLRARGDGRFDRRGMDVQGARVEVGEDGPRSDRDDGQGGEGGGKRRGHDLVARPHPEGLEAELQGLGAVGHRDRVPGGERLRELTFEGLAFGPEDEPAGVEHAGDGRVDLPPVGKDVGAEVHEGDPRLRGRAQR